jgi:hypothetical protein
MGWAVDDAGMVAEWADGVDGSLETQWNLVRGLVTGLMAKVALMLQNQAWGASA